MIAQKVSLRSFKAMFLGCCIGALSITALPAAAVPFKAAFDTVAVSTVNFPIASVHVVGTGEATYLGTSTTETTDQLVNLLTGAGTATYLFTGADGSQLNVAFVFQAIPLPSEPGISIPGTWTVVGGSGRFAGATGSGTADGKVIFTSDTDGIGHFTMDGTISAPGRP